jgi:hypothetical protein
LLEVEFEANRKLLFARWSRRSFRLNLRGILSEICVKVFIGFNKADEVCSTKKKVGNERWLHGAICF